ncbi:MAG: CRISPR-associated endonuclease Cas1 [Verrucomicrobiae bacterium]|nr:CRISPR-associated endonuclease Cas1 [Verrucomicrobiae bacterium]MCX7723238.1 CRISPR-associated endonuclease Cas1 [Verrucomicrobiae bacterium]MDW7979432.1 CRISPR-associated endonuclease Cas1 [Verrucomicrobiales bacterium]
MPTAVLNQSNVRLQLTSERLEVWGPNPDTGRDECLRQIPLHDLERLIVSEAVYITAPALAELMRRGIPIQFFTWSGQFLGNFLPAQNNHGMTRLRQYQQTLDPAFCLQIAKRLVTAKLYNQRRVLQRLAASRSDITQSDQPGTPTKPGQPAKPGQHVQPNISDALAWLDSLFGLIQASTSLDELRGYEGTATARYFQCWATFLPDEFPFERRSTRPPHNPVNACISFAATIIYNEAVAFCHAHGLDPALGTLHSTENGRWSLALDLIEPFRPAFVEPLALDLFSHQILNQSHFEYRDGGCFLNEDGRKKFFLQYERRMERQFLSEHVGHRTTLRQQLEHQAIMFKAALEDPNRFNPFRMN